jgi:hypothetical protein
MACAGCQKRKAALVAVVKNATTALQRIAARVAARKAE